MSREILIAGLTLILLAGAATDRALFHVPPRGIEQYQARIREAAAAVDGPVGPWQSTVIPIPRAAVTLLHPNAIVSRKYTDLENGQSANFLLVQCADARDLVGHYPPRCYVAHGWTLASGAPQEWEIGGLLIHGTRYEFTMTSHSVVSKITIANFMILPDGTTCPDMGGIDAAARDPAKKYLGAGQIQVICDGAMPIADQDTAFRSLVANYLPVIERIRGGLK